MTSHVLHPHFTLTKLSHVLHVTPSATLQSTPPRPTFTMTSTHQLDIAPIGLSFSAQTFQKLAPDSYLLRHLQRDPPTRPSKRAPDEFRAPTLHTGALAHAQGSAVVRVGDTAVVCGVRGEIHALTLGEGRTKGKISVTRNDAVEDEIKTHALLVPNLELG